MPELARVEYHLRPVDPPTAAYWLDGAVTHAEHARAAGHEEIAQGWIELARQVRPWCSGAPREGVYELEQQPGGNWHVVGLAVVDRFPDGIPYRCEDGCWCRTAPLAPRRQVIAVARLLRPAVADS